MKNLFTIDFKDYNENGRKVYRPSVRGIIFTKEGKLAVTEVMDSYPLNPCGFCAAIHFT